MRLSIGRTWPNRKADRIMVTASAKASIGQRSNQEDSYRLEFEDPQDQGGDVVMVLADGMGGHAGGEVASDLVCTVFAEHFVSKSTETRPRARLKESMDVANAALGQRIAREPELRGMGCTLIGALKVSDKLLWVSVGDSILFLLRDGKLSRLNADHSLYGELLQMVRDGKISREEADANPRRNALRSAILGGEIALVDINAITLKKGDLLLLATDGIETLSDTEVRAIMSKEARPDVRAVTSDLLNAVEARNAPSQDNTTVIVYRHQTSGATSNRGMTQWSMLVEGDRKPQKPWGLMTGILALVVALLVGAFVIFLTAKPEPAPSPAVTTTEPTQPEQAERSVIGPQIAPAPEEDTTPDIVPAPEAAPEPGIDEDVEAPELVPVKPESDETILLPQSPEPTE
ncbi:MAG: protein phosphatase 2C domain-containing protein [Pseudomonadota bacterium]